ncbi:MAG: DMT family transporter [Anaerolineae bacterium]|nr:DMT family transporter [Anaerolineae bacterium]
MTPDIMAVVFGLLSAAGWGAGDFTGGFITKRHSVFLVAIVGQIVGTAMLIVGAIALNDPFPTPTQALAALGAGLAGGTGLVLFYYALAVGKMGLASPISAVLTAAVPVIIGVFNEGPPNAAKWLGFGLALVGVWLMSSTTIHGAITRRDILLPLAAGLGFGLFLTLLDQAGETSALWSLVAARMGSMSLLLVGILVTRAASVPPLKSIGIMALAGIFDSLGNLFFVLAAQAGRLDVSSVLSSLYPAATMTLAVIILRERLGARQWVGVALALAAIVFISL